MISSLRMALRIVLTGCLMGIAEVVPGVSGGTIAFISGFYQRLLAAVSRLHFGLLHRLFRDGLASSWRQMDGNFLCLLFGGMMVTLILSASVVKGALADYPIPMWSFFFGLVLASAGSMLRQIQLRSIPVLLTLFLGMILGVALQRVLPTVSDPSPLLLFFGGAIAVCAWILPGVSGSFLLLLLGLYGGVIDAVARVDIIALLPFALGAGIGLVLFANLLRWLFDRLRSYILAFLIGLMMGTLTRLWPWQQVVQYQLHADGLGKTTLMQEPISPIAYQALTGESAELLQAVVGVVLGALLILLFEVFARSRASER